MSEGLVAPAGELTFQVNRGAERAPLAWRLRNYSNLLGGLWKIQIARALRIPHFHGTLSLQKLTPTGTVDYGIVGYKVVTTAGCGFIVDAFQNLVELENMKYHGFGTGTGAEASSDSALGTEFTTEYVVNSTRPTGTTTELSAQVYETVATFAPDSGGTLAVTEHGVFSATSAGVLLDRTKFTAVNLVASSDSLQATYDLTFTAGS
jgi:hypothetical protein